MYVGIQGGAKIFPTTAPFNLSKSLYNRHTTEALTGVESSDSPRRVAVACDGVVIK